MAETIGQQLRKAREERNLSVENIAQVLHIRKIYLAALEDDQRHALPSPVQAKGYLRMYAEYLSLPVRPLLDCWEGKVAPVVEIIKPKIFAPQPETNIPAGEPELTPERPVGSAAVLVVEEKKGPVPEPAPEIAFPTSPKPTSFEQIGKQLREQREALGLSLPEVERYTHVRQHYLEALEDGRIESLPSPVQGRGMLSNYARFLNLDSDALLLHFANGLQTRRIEWMEQTNPGQAARRTAKRPLQTKTGSRRLFSPDLLIGSLMVLLILGFAVWTAAQVDALRSRQSSVTPPSIAEVLLDNPGLSPAVTGSVTPLALLSTLAPGEVLKSTSAGPNSATLEVTLPVTGTAPLQVYILARQRAYLRMTVDGKTAFDGRVEPGIGYPFAGEKKIELLTGSASALQVFYNQKDLGVLGLVGQVKSMIFTKDGSITPTPQFTATRTRTFEPTSTSRPSPTAPTFTITPYIP